VDVRTRLSERTIALLSVAAIVLAQGDDSGRGLPAQLHPSRLSVAFYRGERGLQGLLELRPFLGEKTDEDVVSGRGRGGLPGRSFVHRQVKLVRLVPSVDSIDRFEHGHVHHR
jgi:hypothetical protein